ncbi:MAG: phosphatidylglycerophosphatase A [Candidatus Omnitrophota bacterium]
MREFIIKITGTFFFIGCSPLIPGTVTSAAAIIPVILLKNNQTWYIAATLLVTALGFIVSGPAEKIFRKKDDRRIVIDEVAGMFLTFLFIPADKITLWPLFWGFMLFRAFDALKVYPANKLQRLPGSLGVMADDILAGVYANIILQVFLRFASCRTS